VCVLLRPQRPTASQANQKRGRQAGGYHLLLRS
jgi:hypothetical protein